MEIPRFWRTRKQRLGLVGDVCPTGHVSFPPTDVCKTCDYPDLPVKIQEIPIFKTKGVIYSVEAISKFAK